MRRSEALVLTLALVLGCSVAAATAAETPGAPQDMRVDDVRIEGKLYSPQALFILSRPEERFGRDVVRPHHLQLQATARLLPYRLRPEILEAQRQSVEGTTPPPPTPVVPGRSP